MDTQETPQTPVNPVVSSAPKKTTQLPLVVLIVILALSATVLAIRQSTTLPSLPGQKKNDTPLLRDRSEAIQQFASDAEARAFFARQQSESLTMNMSRQMPSDMTVGVSESTLKVPSSGMAQSDARVSSTNVQVVGIDEADRVKTDGRTIFISHESYDSVRPQIELDQSRVGMIMPPREQTREIAAVAAVPASAMKVIGSIPQSGDLYLSGSTLVVLGRSGQGKQSVTGYAVGDPASPKELWSKVLNEKTSIIASRLYGNTLYLVMQTTMREQAGPCVAPLFDGQSPLTVRCMDVYYNKDAITDGTTVSVISVDASSGKKLHSYSYAGSAGQYGQNVVYMSKEHIYVSQYVQAQQPVVMTSFITGEPGIFPAEFIEGVKKLMGYDLSTEAQMVELTGKMMRFFYTLSPQKRTELENTLTKRWEAFLKKNIRNLDYTGLVKLTTDTLSFKAQGTVPGRLLNQFALDEWKDNLRVAVTMDPQMWYGGFSMGSARETSVNDVYVLNSALKTTGSVTDMGKGERIYAVRFMGDRGFVVTFRQIDPFYVLDLSSATNPSLQGELKIPGYSSYLHPVKEHVVLGIGMENWKLKMSLFDVSVPSAPKELDTYLVAKEYGSEANYNHHAFLQDEKHQIFFVPGYQSSYVFSYAGNKLTLVKELPVREVNRALYIGDTLYFVGNDSVLAYEEGTWRQVGKLSLTRSKTSGKDPGDWEDIVEEPQVLFDGAQKR